MCDNKKCAPIGVFDSGVGGLTVAKEIIKHLPKENIVYFGDTARVPYGGKSKDTIIRYSRQICNFLMTKNVKAIVVACNTASAFALDTIAKEVDVPTIGVVIPGAKTAIDNTKNGKIGIIGTKGTINSGLYNEYIAANSDNVEVTGVACPLFASMVEENMTHDPVTKIMAERYLKGFEGKDIDSLILGCTHYPLLKDIIGEVVGPNVKLVNPAQETAVELKRLLEANDLNCEEDRKIFHTFYSSDAPDSLKEFAENVLDMNIDMVHQVNIEEY